MTTAAAAPASPMVSALEPRLPAHPSHLPMYLHHSPSRVTAQVVGEAPSSCLRRPRAASDRWTCRGGRFVARTPESAHPGAAGWYRGSRIAGSGHVPRPRLGPPGPSVALAPAVMHGHVTLYASRRPPLLTSGLGTRFGAQGTAWDACIT